MLSKLIKAAVLILALAGLSACYLPGFSRGDGRLNSEAVINTAAAQTVAALTTKVPGNSTESPGDGPTVTLTPQPEAKTETPSPLVDSTPTATGTQDANCNQAEFVDDVTVEDGALVMANSRFVKKWALKNTGSCTWNTSYEVVFAGRGTAMTGQSSFPLITEGEVKPGETAHVAVTLTAPGEPGTYRGYWWLRAPDEKYFGIGESGAGTFYVEIEVNEDFYSFADHACEAEWKTGAGPLECPGKESDGQGHVVPVQDPTMEDNEQYEDPGLITMAEPAPGGYIVGVYPAVMVPPDSDFRATISCKPGASGCYVRFKVAYRVDNGDEQVLGEWNEGYEGQNNSAIRDLDIVEGRLVTFYLYLYVNGTPDQSKGIWLNPRITR